SLGYFSDIGAVSYLDHGLEWAFARFSVSYRQALDRATLTSLLPAIMSTSLGSRTKRRGSQMKRSFLLLFVLFLIPTGYLFAQKRAFGIEDLYKIQGVSDVHISPNGKHIVYAITSSDLARASRTTHVWIMDIDGQHNRQITTNAKGENSPRFSPDGKWI